MSDRVMHTHILHANPWRHKEESKNDNSDMTFRTHNKSKAIISLFPSEIAKLELERTQSTAKQNKDPTLKPPQTMGATTNNEQRTPMDSS